MKNIILVLVVFCFFSFKADATKFREVGITQKQEPVPSEYGQIVWYNLVTPNIADSKEFYGSILDWTFTDIVLRGQKFSIIKHNNVPMGSMLEIPNADASIWLASISVSDIQEAITRYTSNGGKLLIEPFTVSNTGEQVILEGPLGEKIAYINNPASPVSLVDNGPNQWIWTELWSNDTTKSKAFYEKVWNVETSQTQVKGKPYWYFEKESKKVAGMIPNPAEGTNTQWVPYVNMIDVEELHEKLRALDVNVMLAPQETGKGTVLIFQDPNGATMGVQAYSN
jgi:predicted enzyme related to lactoylglutathione lyase